MCKLSVIVPVYNASAHLKNCLSSIEAQTVFNQTELILIDDGSLDGSGKICDDFAAMHSNTTVLHKSNGGVSTARNAGLDIAKGKYIGFVDADDTVAPDYFEKLVNSAEKHNCDMSFTFLTLIWNGEKKCSDIWYNQEKKLSKNELLSFAQKMLSNGAQNSACNKIFRHDIIRKYHLRFPIGIKIGEDKHFVLSFLRYCSSAICAGDCGYYYLDTTSSAMHSDHKMQELLSVYTKETELFVSLGLDWQTVQEGKAVHLFLELTDFLQRSFSRAPIKSIPLIKSFFADDNLMTKIDVGLNRIKAENGRIYTAFADAYKKRSILKTLLVLTVHNIITKIGER